MARLLSSPEVVCCECNKAYYSFLVLLHVVLEEAKEQVIYCDLPQKIGFTSLLNPTLHYQHMLQQDHSRDYFISLPVRCRWIILISNWFCIRSWLEYWEPHSLIRSLWKDVGLNTDVFLHKKESYKSWSLIACICSCPSTLLCCFLRRVISLDLSFLVFYGEKQIENVWLYHMDKTKSYFGSFQ